MLGGMQVTAKIVKKLSQKHHVTLCEVWECFLNRKKGLLEDTRLSHKTEPPTLWFIAETDNCRLLKIVFIELDNGNYQLKTAYPPNTVEIKIYEKYA